MRLALDKGAGRRCRVLDDRARRRDDLLVGRVLPRLAQVDVDELEPGVDAGSRRLHAGTVVEVDVHLDAQLGAVVVDHVAQVGETDRCDLAVADLDQHGQALHLRRACDRDERLLVVDVERADGEPLVAASLHQRSRASDVLVHAPVWFSRPP